MTIRQVERGSKSVKEESQRSLPRTEGKRCHFKDSSSDFFTESFRAGFAWLRRLATTVSLSAGGLRRRKERQLRAVPQSLGQRRTPYLGNALKGFGRLSSACLLAVHFNYYIGRWLLLLYSMRVSLWASQDLAKERRSHAHHHASR